MESLPNELKALIACYLGSDPVGDKVREMADGAKIFHTDSKGRTYINGLLHSVDDRPCVVNCYKKEWRKMGKLHRSGNEPAVIYENGDKFWFSEGVETKRYNVSTEERRFGVPEYYPAEGDWPETYTCCLGNHYEFTCYHPETEADWDKLKTRIERNVDVFPEGQILVKAEDVATNPLLPEYSKRMGTLEYLKGWIYIATVDANNHTGRGGYFIDMHDLCGYHCGIYGQDPSSVSLE